MTDQENILILILSELEKAEKKHPGWPTDPIHAAAIVTEEAGELTQACIDYVYSNGPEDRVLMEAVQCGAMAIRFLLNARAYQRTASPQVKESPQVPESAQKPNEGEQNG